MDRATINNLIISTAYVVFVECFVRAYGTISLWKTMVFRCHAEKYACILLIGFYVC